MGLRDVIEEVRQEIAAAGSGINEADTKAALITPILSELGWRGLRRIRSEYPVDQGRMRLDYALIGSDTKPDALIEAKAPREDLAGHVAQVLGYAFHEGVDICVLTNGIVWWLYLPREKGSPEERRFAALDLPNDEVSETADTLESCLRYEALTSGDGERRAKALLDALKLEQQLRIEIPRAWQRLVAGPNEMLIELVQEEVDDVLHVRPSHEQVTQFLLSEKDAISGSDATIVSGGTSSISRSESRARSRRRPQVRGAFLAESRDETAEGESAKESKPSSVRSAGKRPKAPVTGYRLRGQTLRVSSWTDLWTGLASKLYEQLGDEQEFLSRVQRSQRLRGPSRDYFGYSPEGMIRPYRVGNSRLWMESNFSSESITTRCFELMQVFGYGRDDLEILS